MSHNLCFAKPPFTKCSCLRLDFLEAEPETRIQAPTESLKGREESRWRMGKEASPVSSLETSALSYPAWGSSEALLKQQNPEGLFGRETGFLSIPTSSFIICCRGCRRQVCVSIFPYSSLACVSLCKGHKTHVNIN